MENTLIDFLKNNKIIPIEFDNNLRLVAGYHRRSNVIIINPLLIKRYDENLYHITLHELTHATQPILKRWRDFYNKSSVEARCEEVIADTVAMKLVDYFGLSDRDLYLKHILYISQYHVPDVDLTSQIDEAYNFILQNWLIGFNINKAA